MERLAAELLLEVAALGHVAHRHDEALHERVVEEVGHAQLDVTRVVLRVPDLTLDRVARAGPGPGRPKELERERDVPGLE